jgi:hypothetical protein
VELFIAECEGGSPHRFESLTRWVRGTIRFGRGNVDGGLSDYERSLELARDNEDAIMLSLPLGASMLAFESLGLDDRAPTRAHELRALEAGRWRDVAVACLDRDFGRAADLWRESGSRTWEAFLRERAAEELIRAGRRAEGEAQLERALGFYRSVGATYFVERGQAMSREAVSG